MTGARLVLKSIDCMVHIGVTEGERCERQRLEVDLELEADLAKACRTGDLRDTIDYRAVCDAVRAHLEAGQFYLVEVAAAQTLDLLLERFPVRRATVRIRKFVLPRVGHVEVVMERARPEARS
jgi:dihydroneopterin aldolase